MNPLASMAFVATIMVAFRRPPSAAESPRANSVPARPGETQTPGEAQRAELPEDLRAAVEGIDAAVESGDLELARGILRESAASLEARQGFSDVDRLHALLELDERTMTLGCLEEQRAVRTSILEIRTRLLPPEHPEVLGAENGLAATKYTLGDLEGARALFEEVLGVRTRLLPPEHPDLLRAKGNLAVTKKALGDLEGTRVLEEEMLETWARLLPPEHPDLLRAKQNLALTTKDLGDLEGARVLEEEVFEVRTRLLPPEHPDLLSAKLNLAVTKHALGDLEGARTLFEEVLEVRTRRLPPEHPDLLRVKQNLALTTKDLGNLEGARELEEEVLEVRTRLLPPEHPDLLAAKHNLAATKLTLGDFEGARALEEEVLEVWTRLLPPEHLALLGAKQNLALAKQALGDLEGARVLEEQVLEARVRLLPSEHPDVLGAKQNLAVAKQKIGDLEGARALFEEVLAVWTRLLPPEHPDLLGAMHNLAVLELALGELEGARALEEEVLEARARFQPPEHPDLLVAKHNLALTKMALGDLGGARALEEEVLGARTRLLPPEHPDLLAAKHDLALTKMAFGDLEGAYALVESLLAGMRDRSRSLGADSRRAAREGARCELHRLFAVLFLGSACDPRGGLAPAEFSTLESLRMVSVGSPQVALAIGDRAELAQQGERVAELRAAISDLCASPPEEAEEVEAWRNGLQELTGERDAAEYRLFKELSEAGVFVDTIDAASVARELDEGEAAVSYLRYPRQFAKDPETGEAPPTLDSFLAFLVRPDGSVERIELGAAAPIEELVSAWRAELGSPVGGRGVGLEIAGASVRESAAKGEELRRSILDPILRAAGELRSLYVCPDDVLYLAAFDALPLGEGRVGDHFAIHTEVSLARLVRPRRPSAAEPGMLLAGGIDYDAKPASLTSIADSMTPPIGAGDAIRSGPGAAGFLPLAEAEREVEGIAALFESGFGVEPVVLLGGKATKSALAERVRGARFLHVATHGWFAPEAFRSQLDELEDASDRRLLERADATLRGFAPETLCGLALAGANLGRDAVGRVPGILTAEELSSLDLRGCELAVLSACETNVGIRRAGQGIQSLQTALHAAGARTAITSLWKVDDAATRRLMELFYTKLWSEGLGKADALWQAKKALRDEGYPVRDWAAWVLTGDPG